MEAIQDANDGRVPIGYVGDVRLDHWAEPERAILHCREGNTVYLRGADPSDPESGRVPIYEGERVAVMDHIAYTTLHASEEGDDTYMFSLRVVPTREEPGTTYARTLRYGEHDDGRRAHIRPGNQLTIEEMQISIDYVDEWEGQHVEGYVPLTPVLFTWMQFGTNFSGEEHRYLLAAARRLDQSQVLFTKIDSLRGSDPEGAPAVRRALFELVGTIELAVVSLGRAVDMCVRAGSALSTKVPVPQAITARQIAVREIRNAYEHIEDRALGKVRNSAHPDALSIFNHQQVVVAGVVAYGSHKLDLQSDVPALINAARQYLKDVARKSETAD